MDKKTAKQLYEGMLENQQRDLENKKIIEEKEINEKKKEKIRKKKLLKIYCKINIFICFFFIKSLCFDEILF